MLFKTLLLFSVLQLSAAQKPNFVIVIADDHTVYDSTPYGSKEVQTPNMQALADEGLLFNKAYVASPACGPSRAALLTGRMPYNNGIVGNHEMGLKPGVESLIPLLLEQGYDILFKGKVAHGTPKNNGEYVPKEVTVIKRRFPKFETNMDDVEAYLKQRSDSDRPVALFIGCTDTHTPWPEPETARIDVADVVMPARIYDTPEARLEMSRYVEAAENIDRKLGNIRQVADKYLAPENTMIVYTSDHGLAWPFAKWSLYEAGIRTPLLAVWPGTIKPHTTTDAMVSWIDIIPTLIDLAGGDVPSELDGKSFAKVLKGKKDKHRKEIYTTHKGDKAVNVYPIRSVRKGNLKYIKNLHPEYYNSTHTDTYGKESPHGGRHWNSYIEAAKTDPVAKAFLIDYHSNPAEELYDLASDPYEEKNLAELPEYASELAKLRALVETT